MDRSQLFDSHLVDSLRAIGKSDLLLSSHQKEALQSVLAERDTFVSLPTGHGKSVIFELLPHLCDAFKQHASPSAVLVISPLIALMETQISDLRRRGQEAIRLISSHVDGSCEKTARYVFVSPEALEEPQWKMLLLDSCFTNRLKAIFIDEAHCIESWGSGKIPFRMEYGRLATLRSFVPKSVPFVALTATASKNTKEYICDSLEMIHPAVIAISPNRMNLRYSVYRVSEDVETRFLWLVEELRRKKTGTTKTLVFCKSIASCAQLYAFFDYQLQEAGYVQGVAQLQNAMFGMYHAKITEEEKSILVKSFIDEDKGVCRVLICTIAFGMGINIPNISRIIHNGPSESTDAYVQESGRGGRNGEQCEVVLYTFSGSTKGHVSWDMKNYCQNEKVCRRVVLLSHFSGDIHQPKPAHSCCDLCIRKCLCDCVCNQCFCSNQNHVPCFSCCVCDVKCSYVPPFDVVMPMRLMQVHDDLDSQSSSSESSN